MKNANHLHHEKLTKMDKIAIKITDNVGTMGFFLIIFIWTILWLSWNTLAPQPWRFDPYPAFVLWLFISNMIQIFLMPLLLVGQNLQNRHSEVRADNDYEINLKAEQEIQVILKKLMEIEAKLDASKRNTFGEE